MATKSSVGSLGLDFEDAVKSLSKVATTAGQVDKAFAGISASASKYLDNTTKSLIELTAVADKLPRTATALKKVFDSIDGLRVNQNKADYIKEVSSSLSKLAVPLQVLTTLKLEDGISRIDKIFSAFDKIPSRTKIDNLNALSSAIRKFSYASKTLEGIPSNVQIFGGGGGGPYGGGGGFGGGPYGGGGRRGGWSDLTPLTLPGGTGGAPIPLPAFGGTGQPPTEAMTAWNSLKATGNKLTGIVKPGFGMRLALAAPLISMLNERSDVNEQLGTTTNFGLGMGGASSVPGSTDMQRMLDVASARHGISYRDAASLMTSYRKYGSGGLYSTGMTELGRPGAGAGFEGFAGGSRRLQRQLGIDLDEAGDIQGSTRKNLEMNAKQFKEFGDSMVYLSRNTSMSKKEVLDLTKEVQAMGVVTGKSGENAKLFAQDMMVAGGTLSQAGISGGALTSIQKGFTGDMTNYMLNKQMGITSAMKPQEQVMMQQQFISSRLESLAGMDPETRNLMIRMMQAKGLLPADMDLTEIYKEGRLDPAKLKNLVDIHSDKIKKEQTVQGQGMARFWGSAKNVIGGAFGAITNNPLSISPIGAAYNLFSTFKGGPTEMKASGGIVSGSGESDSVHAMLTPGEEVLRKDDPRHRSNIGSFSRGIAQIEGYFAEGKSPNRPQRNFNPGNLRVDADWKNNPEKAMRIARAQGAIGYDTGGYLKFANEGAGFAGLERQILIDAKRGMNVGGFIEKYAPANENDTENYKAFIARKGFGSSMNLASIVTGSAVQATTQMASVAESTTSKASSILSSAGSAVVSYLRNLFNFNQDALKMSVTQKENREGQMASSLLGASSSNGESADKISQAADVMLQAAQTMSSSLIAQASRGSAEQQYRISNIARGNMGV